MRTPCAVRSRGPGIWGKIRRDNVGKVPLAAGGWWQTCKDSSNEVIAKVEEKQTGLAHEPDRAMTGE